jgi:hypothetical protein
MGRLGPLIHLCWIEGDPILECNPREAMHQSDPASHAFFFRGYLHEQPTSPRN